LDYNKIKGIQLRLSENVEGSVELNHITLCVDRLSKGCNTGITEYINLENSGNYKGDDQKGNIFACYQCYYNTNTNTNALLHLQY